jgi:hypothetical protein
MGHTVRATNRSGPAARPRSSRASSSARGSAICQAAWPGCGLLASGGISAEFPTSRSSTKVDIDPATGRLGQIAIRNGNRLHWGFALEYSTLYLTDRFTGGPPKEEPLNQLVPLVEFAFDSPIGCGFGRKTAGTVNPGLSYVAETWQVATEAIEPLNKEAGRNVGVRLQLLFFSTIWCQRCSSARCSADSPSNLASYRLLARSCGADRRFVLPVSGVRLRRRVGTSHACSRAEISHGRDNRLGQDNNGVVVEVDADDTSPKLPRVPTGERKEA